MEVKHNNSACATHSATSRRHYPHGPASFCSMVHGAFAGLARFSFGGLNGGLRTVHRGINRYGVRYVGSINFFWHLLSAHDRRMDGPTRHSPAWPPRDHGENLAFLSRRKWRNCDIFFPWGENVQKNQKTIAKNDENAKIIRKKGEN